MNEARNTIVLMSAQQLFRKTRAGRYVTVSDPYAYGGLRIGTYLVQVRENSTTIRQPVWPDRIEVEAALRELEDQLVTLISDATKARPQVQKLSPKEKRAWDRLIEECGESFRTLTYDSAATVAEKIVGKVREKL